jgi:hypothetical protein
MRNKSLIILFFLTISMFSCIKDLSDLNKDPNTAPNANPEEVLTSAIGYLGWMVDGQYNQYSFIWAQYWTWGPGVAIGDIERYVATGSDFNNVWARAYSNALTDLKYVASSSKKAHAGAAKVLQAYIYQGLVDHFGDIPFSESLKGEVVDGSNFKPKFDDDAFIYPELLKILDEGIVLLSNAVDGSMGEEDLIYKGDIASWLKFANSLKLRILLRMSDVKNVSEDVKTLINSGSFISSSSDIALIPFSGESGNENPMFARMEAGVKNFYVGSLTSMNYLTSKDDPRLTSFYAPAINSGTMKGIPQGSIDEQPFTAGVKDYSQMTTKLYASTNPVILMSDWEVWFLRAEAAARYGTTDDETSSFANAVEANFAYLEVDGASDFISLLDYSKSNSLITRLNTIAIQKWISMNGLQDDEGWIETRRFNVFAESIFATPVQSVLQPKVHPSIWLYPDNELTYNPNAPAQRTLTEKVFWDK